MKPPPTPIPGLMVLAQVLMSLAIAAARAEDKPKRSELIFDVTGLECGSCVYSVYQAIKDTKGVHDVEVMQTVDGYAKVAYDPKIVSEHQIAQAVRDAFPLHGSPYLIKLRLRIPAYSGNGLAARVDAAFVRWRNWVDVEPLDRATGEFLLHFKPLDQNPALAGPQGWTLAHLTRSLRAPAPEGLGLEVVIGQQ